MNFFEKEMRQMFDDNDIFHDAKFVGKTMLAKLDVPKVQMEKDMVALSAGQKKKVLVAASLASKAHIYLWDEPLNYLDLYCRSQLENLLAKHKPTMIFSEHDQAFCDAIATKTIEL